jgi:hypothetical protein
MKDLYIETNGKPSPAKLEDFIQYILTHLKGCKIEADRERVLSALAILDARRQHPRTPISPWQMANGTIMQPTLEMEGFWTQVSEVWQRSLDLHKIAEGKMKPKSPEEDEQALHALETIHEFAELEPDEHQTEASKLLSKHFEEIGGGLILREGTNLSLQDALEAVGVGLQQHSSATKAGSLTNLRLGDIINAVEDRHGDVYTQVVETSGKTYKYISQLKMTSKYFPPKKRLELDPQSVLTYSHYMGCCVKALTDSDREGLIKFAVKRSSTKESVGPDPLKQLASSLAKIKEAERPEVLQVMDEQMESTKEALNLARHMVQLSGGETGARRRYLYVKYPNMGWDNIDEEIFEGEPGWQKLTNDFCKVLAFQADLVIYLPTLKVMEGPDTFSEIPFQYVSPEVIELDPKHPLDIEVYADYRIVEDTGGFHAVGTKNGKADVFQIEGAESMKDALEKLQKELRLTDGRDKLGRLFNLRTD